MSAWRGVRDAAVAALRAVGLASRAAILAGIGEPGLAAEYARQSAEALSDVALWGRAHRISDEDHDALLAARSACWEAESECRHAVRWTPGEAA